ncbi:MAG: response regulator [Spirochaetaceae bacterium]|nr:MAG: response regulator [Spirochaetaceae bacterium]
MNLLVADDAAQIRRGIGEGIDWRQAGIDKVFIAANGTKALDIFLSNPIDIVVADIRMPGLDGLELSERIRHSGKPAKIIILTGHSEFRYARKALQLGVVDYELKPTSADRIYKLVIKARKEIETELASAEALRAKFANDLVSGAVAASATIRGDLLRLFGFDATGVLVSVRIDADNKSSNGIASHEGRAAEARILILQILGEEWPESDFVVFDLEPLVWQFVVRIREFPVRPTRVQRTIASVLQRINRAIEPVIGTTLSAGVSGHGTADALPQQAAESARALQHRLYKGPESVTLASEITIGNNAEIVHVTDEKRLRGYIEECYMAGVSLIIDQEFDAITSPRCCTRSLIRDRCLDLIHILVRTLQDNFSDWQQLFEVSLGRLRFFPDFDHVDRYRDWVHQTYREIIGRWSEVKGKKHGHMLLKAMQFAEARFADPISLQDVAEHISASPNYVGHLFCEEAGITFRQFLNQVRVKHAQRLAESTELLAYEIASSTGFSDYKYFAKVFKQITGSTISQIRKSQWG